MKNRTHYQANKALSAFIGFILLLAPHILHAGVQQKDSLKRSELHFAVYTDDVDIVREVLESGEDINAKDKNMDTPLMYAAEMAAEVALFLIEEGAELDHKNKQGNTALHLASIHYNQEVARALLEAGAGPNIRNKQGETPLMSLGFSGDYFTDTYHDYLMHGADVNIKDKKGNTLLHNFAYEDRSDVIKTLVEHGADLEAENKNKMTPLELAVYEWYIDVDAACELIRLGANTDFEYEGTPLFLRMLRDGMEQDLIRLAINNASDINARDDENETALSLALNLGDREIAELLINKGADVNALVGWDNWPLLSYCMNNGSDRELVIMLLNAGADVNSGGELDAFESSPLYQAESYDREMYLEFVKRGARLIDYDKYEIYDIEDIYLNNRYYDDLAILVLEGEKGEFQNIMEYPIVYLATNFCETETVLGLIEKGCCINCNDEGWFHPLMSAIDRNRTDIVEALLKNGSTMNTELEIRGDMIRPLEYAIMQNQPEIAKILLENGCDPNFESFEGYESLFQLLLERDDEDMVLLMLDHGVELKRDEFEFLDISSGMKETILTWFDDNE